ncbi:unnamed protein product [Calypogeia fissa]
METMAAGTKMVAVIGAGPSGLVAAKSMLEVGLSPVVFDKAPWIGGLWNPNSKQCWDTLKTNISRHSCCFSDFPWDSELPLFPSQRQMFEYLEGYANKFIPRQHFSLGSEVTSVSRREGRWIVHWSSKEEKLCKEFDFVVFASGFLGNPYTPSIPGLDAFAGDVMHSSEYRNPERFPDKRVVVVGASSSAAELAGEIAAYAAQVVNVVCRPVWILSRYVAVEPDSPATSFVPLDFAFYRYSSAGQESSLDSLEELDKRKNEGLRKLCGDQGILNPTPEQDTDPPHVGISDEYREHLRSKRIEVRLRRVQEVQDRDVILEDHTVIADIDCIVFCTGFRTSIPYLSSEVLEKLSFDPSDGFLPLLLDRSTFHPSVPGSAFVGLHKGLYMGIMELQSRWAAAIFAGLLPPIPDSVQQEGIAVERKLKAQIPRPQYPFADYVKFSKSIAAELKVLPSEDWRKKHDIVIPAHFRSGSSAETALAMLETECQELSEGKMVPKAVFHALAGSWTLNRKIDNRMDTSQSGTVQGTATFTTTGHNEYLYSESGTLSLAGGQHFKVYRKYVYAYDSHANRIDVFFEKEGTRDYLFHSLKFLSRGSSSVSLGGSKEELKVSSGWRAEAQHLCNKDMYYPSYLFEFQGNSLAKMEISYSVAGPQKDYTSIATYVR